MMEYKENIVLDDFNPQNLKKYQKLDQLLWFQIKTKEIFKPLVKCGCTF